MPKLIPKQRKPKFDKSKIDDLSAMFSASSISSKPPTHVRVTIPAPSAAPSDAMTALTAAFASTSVARGTKKSRKSRKSRKSKKSRKSRKH